MSVAADINCHLCGAGSLQVVEGFDTLRRVTSDCKPWPRGGRLCVCRACGCVQKAVDAKWLSEIERIYGDYSIYYQSDGIEQAVFDGAGQASFRSTCLLEALAARVKLPEDGRMLDVGCGSGAMLRAFSRFAPRWKLAGSELSDKTREIVESIETVEALYVGELEQIPGSFDMVTMSHMLEHIPRPIEYLVRLQSKLNPGGLLVIEIPNYLQNPFDLLVADHSSHFTARTASELVQKAGYQLVSVATDWVPKELTVVGRKAEASAIRPVLVEHEPFIATTRAVEWLANTVSAARKCAANSHFGILGTSIAATWLCGEVGDAVSFFVDEDPARIGKTFMGRPVLHPSTVPPDSHVFIALPRTLAESAQRRLEKASVDFCLPPLLDLGAH